MVQRVIYKQGDCRVVKKFHFLKTVYFNSGNEIICPNFSSIYLLQHSVLCGFEGKKYQTLSASRSLIDIEVEFKRLITCKNPNISKFMMVLKNKMIYQFPKIKKQYPDINYIMSAQPMTIQIEWKPINKERQKFGLYGAL